MRRETAFVVTLLAGCAAAGDWTRDDTSREAMEADLRACDAQARSYPTLPRPRQGAGRVATDPPDADHVLDLAERVDRCMRGRGYRFEAARRLLL